MGCYVEQRVGVVVLRLIVVYVVMVTPCIAVLYRGNEMSDYEMVSVLMARDDMSREEVMEQINDFKDALLSGELGYDLEEAFMEEFGLEPDYLLDIL